MSEQTQVTPYDEMEARIVAADDQHAEDRRAEMSEYAILSGQLTEEAVAVDAEYREQGHRSRPHTAEGVGISPNGQTAKAVSDGITIKEAGDSDNAARLVRSPAKIAEDHKKIDHKPEAA